MRAPASLTRTFGLAAIIALGAATAALAQVDTTKARVPVRKEQPAPAKAPAGVPATKETAGVPATTPTQVIRPDTMARVTGGDVVMTKDTAHAMAMTPEHCAKMMAAGTMPSMPSMPSMPTKTPMTHSSPMPEACGAMMSHQEHAAKAQKEPTASRYLFGKSAFYIGASAGTAVPFNTFSDLGYDSGFDVTVPVGWQSPSRMLGVRATLAYDQLHAKYYGDPAPLPAMLGSAPDPKIYSGTLDAVLKFPVGRDARAGHGLSLYALGGGGAYLFRGFGGGTQLSDALGGDKVGTSQKNIHKWGVQAGAGMEYGLGPTAVFVESRWVNVFTNGSERGNDYLRWIPIGVGVTLR